jgi:hypothetical protein
MAPVRSGTFWRLLFGYMFRPTALPEVLAERQACDAALGILFWWPPVVALWGVLGEFRLGGSASAGGVVLALLVGLLVGTASVGVAALAAPRTWTHGEAVSDLLLFSLAPAPFLYFMALALGLKPYLPGSSDFAIVLFAFLWVVGTHSAARGQFPETGRLLNLLAGALVGIIVLGLSLVVWALAGHVAG